MKSDVQVSRTSSKAWTTYGGTIGFKSFLSSLTPKVLIPMGLLDIVSLFSAEGISNPLGYIKLELILKLTLFNNFL